MSQNMIPNMMKITKTDYNCDKDQDSNISSKKRLKGLKKIPQGLTRHGFELCWCSANK